MRLIEEVAESRQGDQRMLLTGAYDDAIKSLHAYLLYVRM